MLNINNYCHYITSYISESYLLPATPFVILLSPPPMYSTRFFSHIVSSHMQTF